MHDDDVLDDADRCLLRDSALLALSQPDAAGYMHRKAGLSGWYRYWFSLHGSQLNYHDVTPSLRRGPLAGTISLFRNSVTVAATPKRPRELDLVDFTGKTHALRAESDAQLHWWLQVFAIARNKIPPAKPFVAPTMPSAKPAATAAATLARSPSSTTVTADALPTASLLPKSPSMSTVPCEASTLAENDSSGTSIAAAPAAAVATTRAASAAAAAADAFSSAAAASADGGAALGSVTGGQKQQKQQPHAHAPPRAPPLRQTASTAVEDHLPVDHVLCVVHGIGVNEETLADNVRLLQESYADIASKIFPDLNFRVEVLVVSWRNALTQLDVHRKLQAVVPIAPTFSGESNPLRQFMIHRIIDYVYYTHDRYRRHIMREITSQLNESVSEFRRRRPDFDGHISIFAHSLGAALCYDLLARRASDDQALLASEGMRMNFDVANLFLAGSPLGTFLHLDPGLALGANIRSLPFRVYNIFHPNDPIGTRLEPYVEPRFVGVRPVVVPYWLNMGIRSSTTQWLGTLWSGGSGKKQKSTLPSSSAASGALPDTAKPFEATTTPGPLEATGIGKGEISSLNANIPMQPSAARVGIGARSANTAALAASLEGDSYGVDAFGGVVGSYDDAAPLAYFPEGAQQEVLSSTHMPHRLDYVLQLSSTMEEVSTSWSALRAHTDYWSNRDMMLLIFSSMIKTTHGIPDNVSKLPSIEVDQHVIDSRVGLKKFRFGSRYSTESNELLSGMSNGTRSSKRDGGHDAGAEASFENGVSMFVEKLIEEAAAMHELMLQHPNVRLRQGGITRSSSKSMDGVGSSKTSPTNVGYAGWTSFLPWFSRESSSDTPKQGMPSAAPARDDSHSGASNGLSQIPYFGSSQAAKASSSHN